MEAKFWKERWAENRIGWHRDDVNPKLLRWWPQIGVAEASKVLVPLCGKTLDLLWLQQHGHAVIGNDLSELAAQRFFDEAELEAMHDRVEPFAHLQHADLSFLVGDFFELQEAHLSGVNAWLDRAALVALPEELRPAYMQHLATLLPAGAVGLLISFEFQRAEPSGPPFSVVEDEIIELCKGRFSCELLEREDLMQIPRYTEMGLTQAAETVYRLEVLD
jgi:thiopurine S-methyltransferase